MATIGYARVSTDDQAPDSQVDALEAAGARRVFVDVASGATQERPELVACLDYLRAGDTVTVWRLDRLGRSLGHLIEIVTTLEDRSIDFKSLTEGSTRPPRAGSWSFTSSEPLLSSSAT